VRGFCDVAACVPFLADGYTYCHSSFKMANSLSYQGPRHALAIMFLLPQLITLLGHVQSLTHVLFYPGRWRDAKTLVCIIW
jgi:hypothetical protein